MSACLIVKGVSKAFGELEVLKELNVELNKGEFLTLLGPSGCGKSTLLRCIAGLEAWDSGIISLDGKDLTNVPPQDRGIGMVFQNYALFPTMRALDNVMFGLRMKKVSEAEAKKRAMEALEMVNLAEKAKALPHQLSGGQQQRVALARALVMRPRLLLLDEPLSALDAQIRKTLRTEIRLLQKSLGMTTILVTHDQEEAFAVSDRICLMHQGKILQEGNPREVYDNPRHETAARFLGNFNIFTPEDMDGWTWENAGMKPPRDKGIAIAPESIRIVAPSDVDGNGFSAWSTGQVEDALHLGSIRRYLVAVGGKTLTVDQLNDSGAEWIGPGSRVAVAIGTGCVRILERS